MNKSIRLCTVLTLSTVFWPLTYALASEPTTTNWPGFRGTFAAGVSEGFALPMKWDVEKGVHVKWKTAIPGLGHSSPVIWGDRIFVTTAISGKKNPELKVGLYGGIAPVQDDTEHQWWIYCLNKLTGQIIWQTKAYQAVPRIKRHTKASHANSTPATDGQYLVTFLGSEGLFCYDINGKKLWHKDLGLLDSGYYMVPQAQWGFSSSPVIHGGRVYVQCDVQGQSFVAAYELKDGREVWRTDRDEVPTWSTPAVLIQDSASQLIVNGYKHIGGYDLKTGKELWRLSGRGDIPVPTPVIGHGLIYITSAHGRGAPLYAVKFDAKGDLSFKSTDHGEHIAWFKSRNGAYMQTPLVYGDYLYSCSDRGILKCYNAKTGEVVYRARIGSGSTGFTASPVAGDNKIYFTSEEGDVHVIKPGPAYEHLASNPLGQICMSTPAISEGTMFFRARTHLIAISEKK